MWPIDDQRLRREHEFLRSTQESVYNGTSANTYAPLMNPSTSLQAQLSHERQLAMIELHQRLQASAQASSAVTASMFPHGMGTGDRGYHHDPIGMQHVMSASVSSSEISRLNLLRHLRFREERELLEHRLVFTRQMEEAHRHEIIGRNAIEAANNYLHQSSASEAAQAERTIAASSSKRNGKSNTSLTIEELVPTVSCSPRSEASGSNEKVKAQVLKKDLNGKKLPPSIKTRKSKKKDSRWLETLEELKEYRLKNGHCVIPRGYSQNPRLANWVSHMKVANFEEVKCFSF